MSTAKKIDDSLAVESGQILPQMLHQGLYRLYRIPQNGNLHLVYKPDNGAEQHMEIPGKLLALAEQAANGDINPMDMMKAMGGMFSGIK
jgi:hypothetical protein